MFAKFGIGLLLLIMGLMTLGSSLGVAEMTWLLVDPRAPAELRGNIPQPALAVIASVTLLLMLLFGRISWGLLSQLRGRPSSLMPPWLQIVLAALLGLGGLVVATANPREIGNLGTAFVFLGFAFQQTRAWLRRRDAPPPGGGAIDAGGFERPPEQRK